MKKIGTKMMFANERLIDLMTVYDKCMEECKYIRMDDIYKKVVNMPSSRFWVSDTRATIVVSAIIRGDAKLDAMWALRKEMYLEIYNRVMELKKTKPNVSISELCSIVVAMPAPKFYLTPDSAKIMICKARPKWKREKLLKLQRLL